MNLKLNIRLLIIAGLLAITSTIKAQSYHRLAARDFTGIPPKNEAYLAYTNCSINYTYQVIRKRNNYTVDFDVELALNNNKSYIRLNEVKDREMLLQVLRHEQGHYNIAYLLKCELLWVFKRYHYTANYQAEISTIFNRVDAKYQKLNDDYEYQTQHMQNTDNQEKWNAWFARQMDEAYAGI